MKKSMMIVAVAFVVMMAFTGCQPVVTPPVPEKVPVSGTFENIANTGMTISVYQWDGTGTYYNATDDTAVTPTMFGQDVFAITVGSDTYFNMKFIGIVGSAMFSRSFDNGSTTYHFIVSGITIVAEEWIDGGWKAPVTKTTISGIVSDITGTPNFKWYN